MTDVVQSVVTDGGMPAPAAEEESSSGVNWSELALESDMDAVGSDDGTTVEGDVEVLGPASQSELSETPPAATEAPQTGVEAPPAAPALAAPQTAEIPAQVPPPIAPQAQPSTPQPSLEEMQARQLEALTKHYALDEESSAQLLTEPEVVLPKLLANVHQMVAQQVMQGMFQALPQWMAQYNEHSRANQSALDLFFRENADLRDPSYGQVVVKMGKMFREVNPDASPEVAVKIIGNMVRSALGLPTPQSQGNVATPPAQPTAPIFTPARGGGGSSQSAPAQTNPWAVLAQDFLED